MIDRILGIFKLDVNTFEEIEHDSGATSQAAIIVAIVAVLSGMGSGIGASLGQGSFFISFILTLVWAFIAWILWAAVSWFVGTRLFGGQATVDEMLRVLGFAQAPLMLGLIPCIGGVIGGIWALVAGFIAIRQGLDLDNLKALFTALIGFVFVAIGYALIGSLAGGLGAILG